MEAVNKIKAIFYILALIGFIDMWYQASYQTRCGPIKKALTFFFSDPNKFCTIEVP